MAITFKSIGKKIGKAITAPAKGVVSIAKNPKKGLKNLGRSAGKVFEAVDDIALPVLGFATMGPAGAALGSAAARGIGDGKFNAKATLGAGAKGLALGALGSAAGLQGGQGLGALGKSAGALGGKVFGGAKAVGGTMASGIKKLGGAAANVGKTLGKAATFTDGEFDMQKLLGLGMGASGLIGARQDQGAANKFNAQNAAQRDALMAKLAEKPDYSALMSRITARPNYTF